MVLVFVSLVLDRQKEDSMEYCGDFVVGSAPVGFTIIKKNFKVYLCPYSFLKLIFNVTSIHSQLYAALMLIFAYVDSQRGDINKIKT